MGDHVHHDEAHETFTIAHGKRALNGEINMMMITGAAMEDGEVMNSSSSIMDGPTIALPPQIKRQGAKQLSGVVGVRVTMTDRKLATHGAIIPAKAITATVDGTMIIRRVTRKTKATVMRPQSEVQEPKRIPAVIGGRVAAAHGKTAHRGATITMKTITSTLDGGMTIRRVTRKGKVAAMGPRSESREADQAPAVTGATKAPTNPKKHTVAVAVRLGGKTAMCTGAKRRKRSVGRLNWRKMRGGVVVESPRGNARLQHGTTTASVLTGKRHRNGEFTVMLTENFSAQGDYSVTFFLGLIS
jgi:hypothetical protein